MYLVADKYGCDKVLTYALQNLESLTSFELDRLVECLEVFSEGLVSCDIHIHDEFATVIASRYKFVAKSKSADAVTSWLRKDLDFAIVVVQETGKRISELEGKKSG